MSIIYVTRQTDELGEKWSRFVSQPDKFEMLRCLTRTIYYFFRDFSIFDSTYFCHKQSFESQLKFPLSILNQRTLKY